ncbi:MULTISPECIES: YtzI protein [Ornithinibacillus]|uniref:YtzI protein n=2 Tax=Ornithinibacillus TaxID=484508 RepID=A0A923L5P3_9BACI|nr:YtzI protein [Ornithinibacillus hominis]MBS3681490.1 YtzI protein [Ornithinibacillus massiliensis]
MIWVVAVICILITGIVLYLSILTLDKGYSYKHKVDPLPSNVEEEAERNQGNSSSRDHS